MRLSSSKRRATPSEEVEEVFDIDVTPIMNMFVVLIPFLVSMAVFAHFSIHRFSLPSDAVNTLNRDEGKVSLRTTVVITPEALLVTLGGKLQDSLPFVSDWEQSLQESLKNTRLKSDDTLKAIVSVDDVIAFEQVVTIMDYCHAAGFEDVGLSEAPQSLKDSLQ